MQGTRAVEPSLTVGLPHRATAPGYCTETNTSPLNQTTQACIYC